MPVIFISSGKNSGVQKVVDCLQENSAYKCLSREDLLKEVSRNGKWATEILAQLAKATSSYENFSRLRWPYIVLMRQALLEKIQNDNLIYYGSSGHLLVPRFKHFVRIRINAPLKMRISITMENLKYSEEAARNYIFRSDDTQVRWARFVYGRDIRDPALYDLNINFDHLSISVVCNILNHIMKKDDLQVSGDLYEQVNKTLTAARVEAALVIDSRTRELEIGARMEDDNMLLTGPYLEERALASVEEIARKVDGVENIKYNPGLASQHRLEEHEGNLILKY